MDIIQFKQHKPYKGHWIDANHEMSTTSYVCRTININTTSITFGVMLKQTQPSQHMLEQLNTKPETN